MRSDELDKRMKLVCGEGRRRRGRPRRRWMNEIHEVTGMKLAELCSGVQRFFDARAKTLFQIQFTFTFILQNF